MYKERVFLPNRPINFPIQQFRSRLKDLPSDAPKINSLFLVISYDRKYNKVINAVKNYFDGKYSVYMAKDCMGGILKGICEKIQAADFGIVVLAGLKKFGKGKKNVYVKMNIPFEYGMLHILGKPVMLISEDGKNLEIKTEFSDISNEQYGEKFRLYSNRGKIETRIGQIFEKFIPELADKSAWRSLRESKNYKRLLYSKAEVLHSKLKKIYEQLIKSEFENKKVKQLIIKK